MTISQSVSSLPSILVLLLYLLLTTAVPSHELFKMSDFNAPMGTVFHDLKILNLASKMFPACPTGLLGIRKWANQEFFDWLEATPPLEFQELQEEGEDELIRIVEAAVKEMKKYEYRIMPSWYTENRKQTQFFISETFRIWSIKPDIFNRKDELCQDFHHTYCLSHSTVGDVYPLNQPLGMQWAMAIIRLGTVAIEFDVQRNQAVWMTESGPQTSKCKILITKRAIGCQLIGETYVSAVLFNAKNRIRSAIILKDLTFRNGLYYHKRCDLTIQLVPLYRILNTAQVWTLTMKGDSEVIDKDDIVQVWAGVCKVLQKTDRWVISTDKDYGMGAVMRVEDPDTNELIFTCNPGFSAAIVFPRRVADLSQIQKLEDFFHGSVTGPNEYKTYPRAMPDDIINAKKWVQGAKENWLCYEANKALTNLNNKFDAFEGQEEDEEEGEGNGNEPKGVIIHNGHSILRSKLSPAGKYGIGLIQNIAKRDVKGIELTYQQSIACWIPRHGTTKLDAIQNRNETLSTTLLWEEKLNV